MEGVSLRVERSPFSHAGQGFSTRFATPVTDANGYYEVRHLPEEVIHIMRDSRETSSGVFHLAVLPVNGKTRTVDFGAGSTVSGRLFLNGEPLASTKLHLGDDDTYGWDFCADTTTDANGAFTFAGVAPGKLHLYYLAGEWSTVRLNDWIPVRMLEVNTAARDFGRIDHRTGTVTVQFAGHSGDDPRAALQFYEPNLFQVWNASRARGHRAKGSPFVFEHVGPGKYDIFVVPEDKPEHFRQTLVLSPDALNQTVTVAWPKGTASIRGTIDRALRDMTGPYRQFIRLYSADVRWSSAVPWKEDGRFELGGIPAGEYTVLAEGFRSGSPIPVTLKQIRLAEGETKHLDITRAAIPAAELSKQVLAVSVFTPQGIPIPGCELRLTGPEGELKPTRWQGAEIWFAAPPGTYRLSASFHGAETLTQTVEVKPPFKDGPQTIQDQVLNLTLAPVQ